MLNIRIINDTKNKKLYPILEIETGRIFHWSIDEILEETNRDHSDEYTPYDENDWLDGWREWVDDPKAEEGEAFLRLACDVHWCASPPYWADSHG